MRIAICLSGQPRTWRATRQSLLDYFAGHDLDLYLHSWADEDPAELEAVIDAYRPRGRQIEQRPLFAEEKRRMTERFPVRPPLTTIDMFHSIARSLELALTSGQTYDLVARARFDGVFDGRWPGDAPAEDEVVVPDLYWHANGCTDQFAIGRPSAMALYGGAGDWLKGEGLDSFPGEQWLRPEPVLRHYLEQICRLRVVIRPLATKLLRAPQVGRPFAELVDDAVFHALKHEAWETFARAQFPDVAAGADFQHHGRTALALERVLTAWLEDQPPETGDRLLRAPWPARLRAIDAFIAGQAGGIERLDAVAYRTIRLLCATLLQRMPIDEPMGLESFVVHALSSNFDDVVLARHWAASDPGRLDPLARLVASLGPLGQAMAFANPLEQEPIGSWRPRLRTSAG